MAPVKMIITPVVGVVVLLTLVLIELLLTPLDQTGVRQAPRTLKSRWVGALPDQRGHKVNKGRPELAGKQTILTQYQNQPKIL